MNSKNSSLLKDFLYLMYEIDRASNREEARSLLATYDNQKKYNNIIDNGGFEAISWIGKQIIATKEENNERYQNDSA